MRASPVITRMGAVVLGTMARESQLTRAPAADSAMASDFARCWARSGLENVGTGRGKFSSGRRKMAG